MSNKIIDCHGHTGIISELYPPDVYFKRYKFPKWAVTGLVDSLLDSGVILNIVDKLADITGKEYHLRRILELFNSTLDETVEKVISEMDKNNVSHFVSLMLDLAPACGEQYIEMPFDMQLTYYKGLHHKSKGRIIPFAMVDCRRDYFKLYIDIIIQSKSFFGFKVYPPLWGINDRKKVTKNLKYLFKQCSKNNLPITIHCSKGGIKGEGVSDSDRNKVTSPGYLYDLICEYPEIRLNFAHFGSGNSFIDYFAHGKENNWTADIAKLMMEDDMFPNLYADISFHNQAMDNKYYQKAIQNAFQTPGVCSKILWGTDYPLFIIEYTMKEYIDRIKLLIDDDDNWKLLTYDNPRTFLGMENIDAI